ncbi:hypothetical protein L0244_07075, partial [bacterium]|nr:hypothetical protein [bacterium]
MRFGFIAFLLIAVVSCSREISKPEKQITVPRNVYIITASGTRPDHLSSYMYQSIQTVGLDYFAYDGIRFTRAFS